MESEKRYGYDWLFNCICDRKNGDASLTEQDVIDRLNALEAERDRYMKALEQIELMDPDWTLGVDENMSRLQSIAGRALKGGGDEAV